MHLSFNICLLSAHIDEECISAFNWAVHLLYLVFPFQLLSWWLSSSLINFIFVFSVFAGTSFLVKATYTSSTPPPPCPCLLPPSFTLSRLFCQTWVLFPLSTWQLDITWIFSPGCHLHDQVSAASSVLLLLGILPPVAFRSSVTFTPFWKFLFSIQIAKLISHSGPLTSSQPLSGQPFPIKKKKTTTSENQLCASFKLFRHLFCV